MRRSNTQHLGLIRRCPADPHHRPGFRRRGAAAFPAAGRAVRDRAAADASRRPLQPGHRADEPLLGSGAADRPPGAGRPAVLGAGRLRRAARGRPPRPRGRPGRRDARPGPLPGGADAQARSHGRVGSAGPGPRRRGVHRRPRGAVVSGPPGVRRARRDPRPGRGPAAAPAHGRRRRRHRDRGGTVGRRACRRRRRGRGPPGRRRPRRRARPRRRRLRAAGRPQVSSLTLRRLAALPADSRPLPTVSAYDQLLTRPRTSQEGTS